MWQADQIIPSRFVRKTVYTFLTRNMCLFSYLSIATGVYIINTNNIFDNQHSLVLETNTHDRDILQHA